MNLRELEYLVALDEERHFNRAAERCFVSQPTLSGQLKKLEQSLGVQLVERSTRQVLMTDVGLAVVAQARKVLMASKAIGEIAESFHDVMAGDLQMGLIPTIAPYLLPQIMPALGQQFPDLKLWLHEYQTPQLLAMLKGGELDVVIQALPVGGHDFCEITLFSEPFFLALHHSHPLAQQPQVTLDQLRDQDLLLLQAGHCLREHALDICLQAGAHESSRFHATSLETLRYMVGEGVGMTLMPEMAISLHPQQRAICYLPFAEPVPMRRIGLLYRKESYRRPLFEQLAEVIHQKMAETNERVSNE
ncbi:MAG: DNA-binding transcriptional regulator OxyR [Gammaproteobacteria bacterium]|nr:DNA-binding transcriptional regulator OxyR [Gammaproteobacteria bacterium]MCF6230748.1 DNA-binding transcriptional regulator OxyR [Gammaproteobacteria bacterium]